MKKFTDDPNWCRKLQQALVDRGYNVGPAGVDGKWGWNTLTALKKFQQDNNLKPADGSLYNSALGKLGLGPEPMNFNLDIGASAKDYILNFLTSKISWAATGLVVLVVSWINTRWGFQVPEDVQNWVTGLLVTGFGALIALLRTFWNSPVVVSAPPQVITEKGATK